MSGQPVVYKPGDKVYYALYGGTPYQCDSGQTQPSTIIKGNYGGDNMFCAVDVCVPNGANQLSSAPRYTIKLNGDSSCPGGTLYQGSPAEDWVKDCSNPQPGPFKC